MSFISEKTINRKCYLKKVLHALAQRLHFRFRILFEENQTYLEQATEELSSYLRQIFDEKLTLDKTKANLQDKYRFCGDHCKKLLDHAKEGYENNYW